MTTLGVLVGNRGFFPAELCEQGRKTILAVLKEEGFEAVALDPKDTKYGSVESLADAKKCAELFKANREKIDGILVTLPNFGDERGIADAIRLAGLDVPVLVHAFPDEPGRMAIEHRRDSFCGKMSACNNLAQYGIRYSLTSQHTVDPESDEFRADLRGFRRGLPRRARACARRASARSAPGPPPSSPCATARSSSSGRGSPWRASTSPRCSAGPGTSRTRTPPWCRSSTRSGTTSRTTKIPRESLTRMAKFAVVLDQYIAEHELAGTAIQCWTSMEEYFGVVPCTAMSMLSNALSPSACETDITGLVGHVRHGPGLRQAQRAGGLEQQLRGRPRQVRSLPLQQLPPGPPREEGRHGLPGDHRGHGGPGEHLRHHRRAGSGPRTSPTAGSPPTTPADASAPTSERGRSRGTPSPPSGATAWRAFRGSRTSCATSARAGSSTTWRSTPRASPR